MTNHYRNLKHFYLDYVKPHWYSAFPGLPSQRSIIETINDQLKNISQIEHSRHRSRSAALARSPVNFCVNVLCGLIAYCHQPKKHSLRLDWLLPQSH